MPLEPRFRRVAALRRRFVNRESILEAYAEELSRAGDDVRLLNIVGVGGIGKSRLLRELRDRAGDSHRTATLDLQVPAMRQQEDALAVLRVELGRQGVRFDRFDIGYAVFWQRLHPHLRLTPKELPFIEESEALTQILGDASGIPVFGTALGLVKLAERATAGVRRRRRIRIDDTLRSLDDLSNVELADAVTYLFAQDLRESSAERPYVVFVDAYEALVSASVRAGRASMLDAWLRDLVAQLDRGLVVVASREPLRWQSYDPGWAEVTRQCQVGGLPMRARLELLTESGIADPADRASIARASAGLPFYLHLAIDTWTASGEPGRAVSPEEIVQRFLQHVSGQEIRTLELLSIPRIFDFEIFQALADAFDLPRHRPAWESLTAYSFVYPAGQHGLRLHQLMRAALATHVSPATTRDAHRILRNIWANRSGQVARTEDGVATKARAIRETAYCALHAGQVGGAGLLEYADQALNCGGKQAVDGVRRDLQEFVVDGADRPDLAAALLCMEAEAAVVLGDAPTATGLTPALDWPMDDVVGARLALAAAHGRRIGGATEAARRLFATVWENHAGPVRHRAGFCLADIEMWQGRFRDAFAMSGQILDGCPEDDTVLRGDVARLLHLGHRFALDFAASWREWDRSYELYRRADTVVGLANLKTNRAELLAWTGPAEAVQVATDAIEVQRTMGAQHELGKTFTALAIAQLRLGQFDESAGSFQAAAEALDKAGYRSGRARAELFRAFLHARRGGRVDAVDAARWAVAELVEAEVYPSLIVLAGQFLDALGARDRSVTEAVAVARSQIDALDSLAALEQRSGQLVAALLEERP
jgi:tetratricopeptide (TPR) repeat protein